MIFAVALAVVAGLVLAGLVAAHRMVSGLERTDPPRLAGEASVGTLVWLDRSDNGRLDRLTGYEFQSLLVKRIPELPLEGATRYLGLRWNRKVSGDVVAPSTPFAGEVLARCEAIGIPWLVNHSKRTFELAYLYGTRSGYRFDPEVLYAASLLHDVGLAEHHTAAQDEAVGPSETTPDHGRSGQVRPGCFTIASAMAAGSIAESHGWSTGRMDRLCEAITLHLNPTVSRFQGIEAWLLSFATALDITGTGFWRLYSPAMTSVYERNPLLDQSDQILPMWNGEADREPRCRVAALNQLAFGHLVATSPVYRTFG